MTRTGVVSKWLDVVRIWVWVKTVCRPRRLCRGGRLPRTLAEAGRLLLRLFDCRLITTTYCWDGVESLRCVDDASSISVTAAAAADFDAVDGELRLRSVLSLPGQLSRIRYRYVHVDDTHSYTQNQSPTCGIRCCECDDLWRSRLHDGNSFAVVIVLSNVLFDFDSAQFSTDISHAAKENVCDIEMDGRSLYVWAHVLLDSLDGWWFDSACKRDCGRGFAWWTRNPHPVVLRVPPVKSTVPCCNVRVLP